MKLTKCLVSNGFKQSKADYSLFTKVLDHGFVALLVYVDDIVIAGSSQLLVDELK